MNKYNC